MIGPDDLVLHDKPNIGEDFHVSLDGLANALMSAIHGPIHVIDEIGAVELTRRGQSGA